MARYTVVGTERGHISYERSSICSGNEWEICLPGELNPESVNYSELNYFTQDLDIWDNWYEISFLYKNVRFSIWNLAVRILKLEFLSIAVFVGYINFFIFLLDLGSCFLSILKLYLACFLLCFFQSNGRSLYLS